MAFGGASARRPNYMQGGREDKIDIRQYGLSIFSTIPTTKKTQQIVRTRNLKFIRHFKRNLCQYEIEYNQAMLHCNEVILEERDFLKNLFKCTSDDEPLSVKYLGSHSARSRRWSSRLTHRSQSARTRLPSIATQQTEANGTTLPRLATEATYTPRTMSSRPFTAVPFRTQWSELECRLPEANDFKFDVPDQELLNRAASIIDDARMKLDRAKVVVSDERLSSLTRSFSYL